jgi:hypothetical protein
VALGSMWVRNTYGEHVCECESALRMAGWHELRRELRACVWGVGVVRAEGRVRIRMP